MLLIPFRYRPAFTRYQDAYEDTLGELRSIAFDLDRLQDLIDRVEVLLARQPQAEGGEG